MVLVTRNYIFRNNLFFSVLIPFIYFGFLFFVNKTDFHTISEKHEMETLRRFFKRTENMEVPQAVVLQALTMATGQVWAERSLPMYPLSFVFPPSNT